MVTGQDNPDYDGSLSAGDELIFEEEETDAEDAEDAEVDPDDLTELEETNEFNEFNDAGEAGCSHGAAGYNMYIYIHMFEIM